MTNAAVKRRLKEILEYFTKQYVKAFKSELILDIRNKTRGETAKDPVEWKLMLPKDRLIPDPQKLGPVYYGKEFKTKRIWKMRKNYIVEDTAPPKEEEKKEGEASTEEKKEGDAPAAPASPSADSKKDEEEERIWLDDSESAVCMNPECGEEFTLFKRRSHCRQCGKIFCRPHCAKKIGKDKFCDACHEFRTKNADKPDTLPTVLERPKDKFIKYNFGKYKVSIPEYEKFLNAGADKAAADAKPAGLGDRWALELTHKRSSRPQLVVAFDTKEDRDQWKGLLEDATKYSPIPITTDPVLQRTFIRAYRATRWHCWIWSSWEIDGTEAELLADTLYYAVEVEAIPAKIRTKGEFAMKLARKALTASITAAITPVWKGLMGGLGEIRAVIEPKAQDLLGPIFEEEKKIQEKIAEPIKEAVIKALASAEETISKGFSKNLPVIGAAAEAELKLLPRNLLKVKKEADEKTIWDFAWHYQWMVWRLSWLWWSDNEPISRMINDKFLEEGYDSVKYNLAYDLSSPLKDLNQSAWTVIREKWDGQKDKEAINELIKGCYPDIVLRAGEDIKTIFFLAFHRAIDDTLRPPLMEAVKDVLKSICEPLSDVIPEAIKDIVDPVRTGTEIINDVLIDVVKKLAQTALAGVFTSVDEQAKELAEKGLVE